MLLSPGRFPPGCCKVNMLIFANAFGWIVAHRRLVAGAAAVLFLVIGIALVFRACNKPPKLDQQDTIKAQQAIENSDRKVMIEVLTKSKVEEQGIDNSIKAAEEATEKAKRDYSKLSNDELAAELEKRLQP